MSSNEISCRAPKVGEIPGTDTSKSMHFISFSIPKNFHLYISQMNCDFKCLPIQSLFYENRLFIMRLENVCFSANRPLEALTSSPLPKPSARTFLRVILTTLSFTLRREECRGFWFSSPTSLGSCLRLEPTNFCTQAKRVDHYAYLPPEVLQVCT